MKLKKARTCKQCKALEETGKFRCGLWYALSQGHDKHFIPHPFPLEPCPKPLTNDEFFSVKKELLELDEDEKEQTQ